ncbi:MAG TPA: TonB-dependent receptor, partial [Bacteroidetes bacterium]|nr:TonB-dependent receptor [Bacteroidota bacterium]
PRLSFTPGVRFEYIKTASKGSYFERAYDLAENLILEEEIQDGRRLDRNLILAGIGLAYVLKDDLELYANFSQNYRAVNFNDLRVVNPNYRVDETLHDERGFNLDLGLRGQANNWLSFDLSAFFLNYRDRIGQVLRTDIVTFQYYRFRTNIANSRNIGLEMYAEADLFNLFNTKTARNNLVFFTNFALIDSRYLDSEEPAFDGKQVEMSPPLTLKTGINLGRDDFKLSLQWAFTSAHFTDATNAISTPNSVEGIIPSYQVMDLSMSYHWRFLQMEAGCNNLLNTRYYTRRATAYPGPGIVPAAGRSIYFTIQVKI